jgi:hypothetical protein
MYKNERLTKQVLAKLDRAEQSTLQAMRDGRVEHEPSITDRMLAYIEARLDGTDIGGVRWTAKTLTSIGINSQETEHGADFFGLLDLRLPGYNVKKGFLAQAKKIEPGQSMSQTAYNDLRDQCDRMHNRSPVSYVFIYSLMSGIRVVSANDVLASHRGNPLDLTSWSMREFFRAHFECFIGDYRLSAATPEELEALTVDVRARNGIRITGQGNNNDIPPNRFG